MKPCTTHRALSGGIGQGVQSVGHSLQGQHVHVPSQASLASSFARVVPKRHLHVPSNASLASSPNRAAQEEAAYRHNDSFDFILGSMRKCLNHLGPWSIGDLAFGL